MRRIDRLYTEHPFYGSRRMTAGLRQQGVLVNRKHVQRLMRQMGLEAIYPTPRRRGAGQQEHRVYPYLLRGVAITHPDQVWSTDITYVPLERGYVYLTAILDWFSRYVVNWQLSRSLETTFCLQALETALAAARPLIFNSDQGTQFTSQLFTGCLERHGIAISMDGRGRCHDNIFIERLWRTVKYEEVYLKAYQDLADLEASLDRYFRFYNTVRLHQALGYRTPQQVYTAC